MKVNIGDNEESEEDEKDEGTEEFILMTREEAWQQMMNIITTRGFIKTVKT